MCDRLDKTWRIKKYQQITYSQVQFNCNLFTQAQNTYWRILLNSLKGVGAFQIELKFNSVGFRWEGKTRVPEEKLLGARRRTSNGQWQTQPTYGVDAEIWPRWREKSVVTNAPPLLPSPVSWVNKLQLQCIYILHVALIFQYIKDGP